MKRRTFIHSASKIGLGISVLGLTSCNGSGKNKKKQGDSYPLKLSLAQWSIHKMILENNFDPYDFAKISYELGFEALEYVGGLYLKPDKKNGLKEVESMVSELNIRNSEFGLDNHLIMVDREGAIASLDKNEQNRAIHNHYKWVDAAHGLNCQSIRVNLFGETEQELWIEASVKGLTKLCEYATKSNINVLVENHGHLSSNGKLLSEVMKLVNLENCGTLPDFGNFCLKRENGEMWGAPCVEEYDKYQGIAELMPYAKGVSAKSYDFDQDGNETTIDYNKMLSIVKNSGFNGYIGVEFEGEKISEKEGIHKTKALVTRIMKAEPKN